MLAVAKSTLKFTKRSKNVWPDPTASIGETLCTMGRNSCWEAVGPVREMCGVILREIKTLLESRHEYLNEEESVPHALLFGIYMIGRDAERAKPTIIFSCENKAPRQKAVKLVRESLILEPHPGILLGECSRPPILAHPPVQLLDRIMERGGHAAINADFTTALGKLVYYDPSIDRGYGISVSIRELEKNSFQIASRATIGGIISSGDKLFGPTVAHAFLDVAEETYPAEIVVMDFSLENENSSDENEESEEDDNELSTITSQGSVSLKCSDIDASTLSSTDSIVLPQPIQDPGTWILSSTLSTTQQGPPPEIKEVIFGRVSQLSLAENSANLDWAMIELETPRMIPPLFASNSIDLPIINEVYGSPDTNPQASPITVVTGSNGKMSGTLSGSLTFMQLPNSIAFQEMWTIHIDGVVSRGDCGSWVINRENGQLYGHIVAGDPGGNPVRFYSSHIRKISKHNDISVGSSSLEEISSPRYLAGHTFPAFIRNPSDTTAFANAGINSNAADGEEDAMIAALSKIVNAKTTVDKSTKTGRRRMKSIPACLTCWKQHIKCGKEWPSCTNCTKSGQTYEGYYKRVNVEDATHASQFVQLSKSPSLETLTILHESEDSEDFDEFPNVSNEPMHYLGHITDAERLLTDAEQDKVPEIEDFRSQGDKQTSPDGSCSLLSSKPFDAITISSTRSLLDSDLRYYTENNRRYVPNYFMPNDADEEARLQILHHVYLYMLDSKLTAVPPESPLKILDVGTGTGEWAIGMADTYPQADVTGIDLSAIQPHCVPPNVFFEILDAEDDESWTYPENFYDLIHLREMAGSIRSWDLMYNRAYKHLKPGGWIEIVDFDDYEKSFLSYLRNRSEASSWYSSLKAASSRTGKQIGHTHLDPERLANAGFEDISCTRYEVPIGTWPTNPNARSIAKLLLVGVLAGFESYSLRHFTRELGWSLKDVQGVCSRLEAELRSVALDKDKSRGMCVAIKVAVARKPMRSSASEQHLPQDMPGGK